MLRIRFQYPAGYQLGYAVERLQDGLFFDFATTGPTAGTFTATPVTLFAPLPPDSRTSLVGRYVVTMPTPPAIFTNGDYTISVATLTAPNEVVAELAATIFNGDDATVFPSTTFTVQASGPVTVNAESAVAKPLA